MSFNVGDYVVCINNLNCEEHLYTHNSNGTPYVDEVFYVHSNGFINITTPEPTIDELGDDPSRFRHATEEEIQKYVEQSNLLWGKAIELINQRMTELSEINN